MIPSIELRLQTMVKSLQDVILPAIASDNALAREQVQLLIAHLGLIGQQWPHAAAYDALSLEAMLELAACLAEAAKGGPHTRHAAEVLGQALQPTSAPTTARRAELAAAIDDLVTAAADDGSDACRDALTAAILDHAARQAWRDRVWFAGSGMDPERASLAGIDAMLAGAVPDAR